MWDHYGYQDNEDKEVVPIIDSAYVLLDFNTPLPQDQAKSHKNVTSQTIGCLELCMFAEGSRHQEEIIVTGMKGRIEGTTFHIPTILLDSFRFFMYLIPNPAYLPENKVFLYQRPTDLWKDKSKPPPLDSFSEVVYDCSNLRQVYDFADEIPNMHSGYHYCSTAIEWKYLIDAIKESEEGKPFIPKVSLEDGIKAVEMGISSMSNIANAEIKDGIAPVRAFSSQSSENLMDLIITNPGHVKEAFMRVIDACDGEYKANFD